jgi:hypothetical protein
MQKVRWSTTVFWLPKRDAFYRDPCPLFSLILTSDSQGRLPYVAVRCERLLTGRLLQRTKFCSMPIPELQLDIPFDTLQDADVKIFFQQFR